MLSVQFPETILCKFDYKIQAWIRQGLLLLFIGKTTRQSNPEIKSLLKH